jgi:hypothetical protein
MAGLSCNFHIGRGKRGMERRRGHTLTVGHAVATYAYWAHGASTAFEEQGTHRLLAADSGQTPALAS